MTEIIVKYTAKNAGELAESLAQMLSDYSDDTRELPVMIGTDQPAASVALEWWPDAQGHAIVLRSADK